MGQSGKLIGKTYTMKCARPSLLGFHRSLQWLQYHHSNNGSWNWKLSMNFNSCFRRHTVNPCCWLNMLTSTVTPHALPQLPWLTDSKWLCPKSQAEEDPQCLKRKENCSLQLSLVQLTGGVRECSSLLLKHLVLTCADSRRTDLMDQYWIWNGNFFCFPSCTQVPFRMPDKTLLWGWDIQTLSNHSLI